MRFPAIHAAPKAPRFLPREPDAFTLTLAPTVEAVARWTDLAPRAGRKPATITLPGDPQRYIVRGVTMLPPIGPLVVELVSYPPTPRR